VAHSGAPAEVTKSVVAKKPMATAKMRFVFVLPFEVDVVVRGLSHSATVSALTLVQCANCRDSDSN